MADAPARRYGTFVTPTLIEIGGLGELEREVFGPVLHVLRYRRDELARARRGDQRDRLRADPRHHIRASTRRSTASSRARTSATIYVNRNIIGAVVGVQPFGGEGLSGTGPKAGGPLYLRRLVRGASSSGARPAAP